MINIDIDEHDYLHVGEVYSAIGVDQTIKIMGFTKKLSDATKAHPKGIERLYVRIYIVMNKFGSTHDELYYNLCLGLLNKDWYEKIN